MRNRGIRIEKPIGSIETVQSGAIPSEVLNVGWTFRGLLVLAYLLAFFSIFIVYYVI